MTPYSNNPPPVMDYGPPGPRPQTGQGKAITSLILGICSVVFWLCPLVGFGVSVTGLIFGVLARKESKSGMALAGIILCGIGLLLSFGNGAWGAYLGATGQHPLFNANGSLRTAPPFIYPADSTSPGEDDADADEAEDD